MKFSSTDLLVLRRQLAEHSPAPFSAYLDCGDFQLASASPEMFLRLSGSQIQTRPIKGTRPRGADPESDARLAYELQTSPNGMSPIFRTSKCLGFNGITQYITPE